MAIGDENTLDSKEQKKFIQDTTLKVQHKQVEQSLESGSIKITPDIAKQAVFALKSRIEATAKYTADRVERIDKNYNLYNDSTVDNDSVSQLFYPAVRNATEDWIDDLYLTFINLDETLEIDSKGDELTEFLQKTLNLTEGEEETNRGMIRSIIKSLFNKKNIENKSVFYFRKKEAMKELMKKLIDKSGYKKKLEDYLKWGTTSGHFCRKDKWAQDRDFILTIHEDTEGDGEGNKEYIGMGDIKLKVDNPSWYKFHPVDTRNLIFRKDIINWVIEQNIPDVTFSSLLEATVDDKGKPKETALYDFKMLANVKKFLKENPGKGDVDDKDNLKLDFDLDMGDIEEAYKLDGDLDIKESHDIPIVIDGKSVKTLMTFVELDGKFIPIRVQQTPFIKLPYKFDNFSKKNGDVAGQGLPEIVERLQSAINGLSGFSLDMLNFAISGIAVVDTDHIQSPEKLRTLSPRDVVKLKNMRGKRLDDVIKFIRPPVDMLSSAMEMFELLLNILNVTTRKGPSGAKITPNPSATEASSIISELQKSVNRMAHNLTIDFSDMLDTMYIYTMMNRTSYFEHKFRGFMIGDTSETELKKIGEDGQLPESTVKQKIKSVRKALKLTPKELFIDGLSFEIKALDMNPEKKAIDKQQLMQAMELMYNLGLVNEQQKTQDPATGQEVVKSVPKEYIDDTGRKVTIDEYSLLTSFMAKSNIDQSEVWKPVETQEEVAPNSLPGQGAAPSLAPVSKTTNPVEGNLTGAAETING